MVKKLIFICILFLAAEIAFADIQTALEINGVIVQGGGVAAVYSNKDDYKAEKPFISFTLEPVSSTIVRSLELPSGEYVAAVFQDVNSNGKLDKNFLGIPKEPIGITNYSGKGFPGGFEKLKVPVNNNSTKITVNIGNTR